MEAKEENVRVVVRCRPLLPENGEEDICVELEEEQQTIVVANRQFAFDRIFGFDSTQIDVYTQAARQIVDFVLQGYNGTIFAYGQTGTGKTFTASGVLSLAFAHIFGFIAKSANDTQFLVRASYYEIYNEEIHDLLKRNENKSLELKESSQNGVYVKDLSCFVVNNVSELQRLKEIGDKQRAVAATNMNRHSSRSHTVFTLTVEMIKETKEDAQLSRSFRVGKLHLVDLAGSERQSKTGTAGDRLKEAAKINLSLTSLSLVIAALTDPKSTHIPYRNSKLTRLLSDSLGGNSKTLLVACIGPAKVHTEETISTLRFSSTAKRIKNVARINEDAKDTLLRRFQDQIAELKRQLEAEADMEERKVGEEVVDAIEDQKAIQNPEALEKLKNLEAKIIVGGENLLEKAELQERLLAESEAELQERRNKEAALKMELEKREAEILQIEESYGTLQEEVVGLNKKLKKVFTYLGAAKSELADTQCEYSKLREDLLDTIRATHKEIKLANFIIANHIPASTSPKTLHGAYFQTACLSCCLSPTRLRGKPTQDSKFCINMPCFNPDFFIDSYFEIIQDAAKYNELLGEWQLKCIAYTGNNMQEKSSPPSRYADGDVDTLDLQHVYLSYNSEN